MASQSELREDRILLRCPDCGLEKEGMRAVYDPIDAAVMKIQCPECGMGNKPVPVYYDKHCLEVF